MSDDVGLGKVSDETVLFENKDAQNGEALMEPIDKEDYNFPRNLNSENTVSEVMMALAVLGRPLDNISLDLVTAVKAGRVPTVITNRYVDLDKSPFSH
ncbi:hypothetical protein SUGI_0451190 [Cryptomeria japonica]|nr:hypothetical protein SUGI_0451190 [Cryptomeria japonica]